MQFRNKRGNMLAMVAATAMLLVAVMMFGLTYLNVARGNLEQKTAAEAAALAAAQDISRIVIDTPECGYVSLCDIPPNGKGAIAADNYFCQVRSINELMGTARLNYIIASELNDEFMKNLAIQDRDNVLKAKSKLDDEIKKTLSPGGKAKDVYGNDVATFDDAFAIYEKNLAKTSEYVPPTLKLRYGSLENGIATQVGVPNPIPKAQVSANQTMGGCYVSEMNIKAGEKDFVFASTGKRVSLGDASKFRDTIEGLPFQMPAVVRIDADQKFHDQDKTYVQHFAACASAGNDIQHPVGGALTISFPDGPVAELTCPADLFSWKEMVNKHCDVLSAETGDFPVDAPLASIGAPVWSDAPAWPSDPPTAAMVSRLGVYDWIRYGGTKVNIDSVVNMFKSGGAAAFDAPSSPTTLWKSKDPKTLLPITLGQIPQGILHIYTFKDDGSILYRTKTIKPDPYTVAAHKQLYAELSNGEDLNSKTVPWKILGIDLNVPEKGLLGVFNLLKVDFEGTSNFDFYVRDQVRERGAVDGGKHDGSSMDCDAVAKHPQETNLVCRSQAKNLLDASSHALAAVYPKSCSFLEESYWNGCNATLAYGDQNEVGGNIGVSIGGIGIGIPPTISKQDDFATSTAPPPGYNKYSTGGGSGAPRPTYTKNGLAVELRFRRQTRVGDLLSAFEVGYVGEMD